MIPTRWRDRWVAWRNRLFADPRFQRWAADFPLTRGIARRRAKALFDLVAGFVYSQTLAACLRLGVLELLAAGPADTAAVAAAASLSEAAAERLLGAGAALGLIERAGPSRWALGQQGAVLRGDPGLTRMILHQDHLYADMADTGALLRTGGAGRLAAFWPYADGRDPKVAEPGTVGAYSALMSASQPSVAADVLDAFPMGRRRCLMDVGGGEGAFLAAAAARAPKLELMLYDLPAVAERARARLQAAGVLGRARLFGGNFLADPLPAGADLITLIRILHDQDDAGAATLLRAVRLALPEDGALLVAEPMSGAPRPDPVADVYFAFYLQAMGRGRARTPREIFGLLDAAGFRHARLLKTRSPFLLRAIVARP